jgi:ABC-type amino acid transport substrate-binding protein
MKKLLLFLFVVATFAFLASCESQNTLVVGLECDYPPFNWIETSKSETNVPIENMPDSYAQGYDVAIAKIVAEHLERKLVIKAIEWEGLVPALLGGEIDAIIAGMSPTAEKKETISFSDAYYTSNHVALVKADGAYANVTALTGLSGARGIGQIETTYARLVSKVADEYGAIELPVMDAVPEIVNAINGGAADFTILEYPVAVGVVSSRPGFKILFDNPAINYFDVADEDRDVSVGLKKEDLELIEHINQALATISLERRNEIMLEMIALNG